MKRIGFFGGCFNPPTNIHIKIANDLIKQGEIDSIFFVPVNDYYKKDNLISSKHRYNMLKLMVEEYKNIEIEDIEIKLDRKLYAVDIFEMLKKKYFNDKLFMIMGSDNFNNMHKWKDYDKIKDEYNYIIIERNNNDISSTDIRNMIKSKNDRAKEYLPNKVYKYILENKLYKED